LLSSALVLAACSAGAGEPTTTEPIEGVPALIAMLVEDGDVATYDPATATITQITSNAGPGRVYSQPTWSHDGNRLAFVENAAPVSGIQASSGVRRVGLTAQAATPGSVHIATPATGEVAIIATPFSPFYLYWSPDGNKLAFLGNDLENGRQALGIIDTTSNVAERADIGAPYYFAWAPGSDRLLVHAANRELYYLALDGTKQSLPETPGRFSAPGWVGDTQLFPVLEGRRQILRLFDENGGARRDAVDFGTGVAIGLSPDEEAVAYITIETGVHPFALGPLTVDTPAGATEVAELAAAFFWAANGSQLLYLTPDVAGDDFGLRWNTWDGTASIEYERFTPTGTFVQQYLPFFGQYANSLTFLSPDADSFTFAGTIDGRGEGIWVQPIGPDATAELIGPGRFSTWAP
jgi:TolB protein